MTRLRPLTEEELPEETRVTMRQAQALMGFQANDALTMARHPQMLSAFGALVESLFQPSRVEPRLKRLLGYMTSSASGCQYCQAHTSHSALGQGIDTETLNDIWNYEFSESFSDAERAALRIAHHGSLCPSGVDDGMYASFAAHYSEAEQVEVLGIISMFGFLNRWNAIVETDVETLPGTSMEQLRSS